LIGLQTLDSLGITYSPDATYRAFSVVDILGDMSAEGNGFESATWHWNAMGPGDADILYAFLNGDISVPIYIRTRLNRLNVTKDDYEWGTFSAVMTWMTGDESVPALHVLDVTITFTALVRIPDYP